MSSQALRLVSPSQQFNAASLPALRLPPGRSIPDRWPARARGLLGQLLLRDLKPAVGVMVSSIFSLLPVVHQRAGGLSLYLCLTSILLLLLPAFLRPPSQAGTVSSAQAHSSKPPPSSRYRRA